MCEFALHHALQTQVDRQLHRLATLQLLIEVTFNPGQPTLSMLE